MDGVLDRCCKTTCDEVDILQKPLLVSELLTGLTLLDESYSNKDFHNTDRSIDNLDEHIPGLKLDKFICATCTIEFSHGREQRTHFKSDWHRYNLHQSHKNCHIYTEEEFNSLEASDSSSSMSDSDADDISESDSHSDGTNILASNFTEATSDESENNFIPSRHAKVFFRNKDKEIISMYRSILYGRQNVPSSAEGVVQLATTVASRMQWAILLLAGGHFAGAVFNGNEIVCHKTHKRYVTRRKQGGLQSTRDGSGGSAPKSAGASLRRYCETALRQDIQNTLKEWNSFLITCQAVFIRASAHQKSTFVSSSSATAAPFKKDDPRLRTIPLATKRPTLEEVRRVHTALATLEVYDKDASFEFVRMSPKKQRSSKMQNGQAVVVVNEQGNVFVKKSKSKDKSVEKISKPDDMDAPAPESGDEKEEVEENEKAIELSENLETIDFTHLEEFGHSSNVLSHVRRRNRKKKKVTCSEPSQQVACDPAVGFASDSADEDLPPEFELLVKQRLFTAVTCGDLETTECLLSRQDVLLGINRRFSSHRVTILHVAADSPSADVVTSLLRSGTDPTRRDGAGKTPYEVATRREHRNAFRRFMADNPERYDYCKAKIPSALTAEQEEAQRVKESERRRVQKAQRREKEKVRKAEEREQKREEEEKQRYLQLSDREKRALAAERRMAAQARVSGAQLPSCVRCFLCATDLSNKVPFEYCSNLFCTTHCLRKHRDAHAAAS